MSMYGPEVTTLHDMPSTPVSDSCERIQSATRALPDRPSASATNGNAYMSGRAVQSPGDGAPGGA